MNNLLVCGKGCGKGYGNIRYPSKSLLNKEKSKLKHKINWWLGGLTKHFTHRKNKKVLFHTVV